MVPEGWSRFKLQDLSSKPISYGIVQTGDPVVGGIRCLRVVDITKSAIDIDDLITTSEEISRSYKRTLLENNEIVLALRGDIGKSLLVDERLAGCNLTRGVARIAPKSDADSAFLFQMLISPRMSREFELRTNGSALREIPISELRKVPISLPPPPEQQKIAAILSTWDRAIELTEKLIAAKQSRKQALMQQLLIGKVRFSGTQQSSDFHVRKGFFERKLGPLPSDWAVRKLSDFFWFQEGPGVQTQQFTSSGVKLFNGSNIQAGFITLANTSRFISDEEAYGRYKHFLADEGDLVIASSGIAVDKFDEKIAFLAAEHLPICMNTSTIRFKSIDKNTDIRFLRYFMMNALFKNQIRRQITGSAQLNFGPTHLKKCIVALPPIDEQKEIARCLTSVEVEIEKIQNRRALLIGQKRGLMQQLLTGKVRVNVDAEMVKG